MNLTLTQILWVFHIVFEGEELPNNYTKKMLVEKIEYVHGEGSVEEIYESEWDRK